MIVVIAGLIALLVSLGIAMHKTTDSKEVVAIMGSLSGTIGTLVGAFFGFHAGASGKEKAQEEKDKAQANFNRLAGMAPAAAQSLNLQ